MPDSAAPAPGRRLFVSASFPSADERGERAGPSSPEDITAGVSAIARVALSTGWTLVFGGHPTITPWVLSAAREQRARGQVVVYQSRWFEGAITEETWRLASEGVGRIEMTEAGVDLAGSLEVMRAAMLREPLAAAFFVGGMEGIRAEYELFGRARPDRPRFLLVEPGGFAARLAADVPRVGVDTPELPELLRADPGPYAVVGRSYLALATTLLAALPESS